MAAFDEIDEHQHQFFAALIEVGCVHADVAFSEDFEGELAVVVFLNKQLELDDLGLLGFLGGGVFGGGAVLGVHPNSVKMGVSVEAIGAGLMDGWILRRFACSGKYPEGPLVRFILTPSLRDAPLPATLAKPHCKER